MIQIIDSIAKWRVLRQSKVFENKSVGFVPTMGALHDGHCSLLKKSRASNDLSVLSIFVNPTQFNDPNDLVNYPRDLEHDIELAASIGTDFVFLPKAEEIYSDDYRYNVNETERSSILEGVQRPGHFTGVLTVVMKLFNLVAPTTAYFGEKDYQQYMLIKGMVDAFFMNINVVGCPTVRASDGLALSSRNVLLSEIERSVAHVFPTLLKSTDNAERVRNKLEEAGLVVEYLQELEGRRYGAIRLGKVRLIDNVEI